MVSQLVEQQSREFDAAQSAETLRSEMLARNLSQSRVAAALGVRQNTVSRWTVRGVPSARLAQVRAVLVALEGTERDRRPPVTARIYGVKGDRRAIPRDEFAAMLNATGVTQAALAERVNVSQCTVSDWVLKRGVSAGYADAVTEALRDDSPLVLAARIAGARIDAETLRRMMNAADVSIVRIAVECGVRRKAPEHWLRCGVPAGQTPHVLALMRARGVDVDVSPLAPIEGVVLKAALRSAGVTRGALARRVGCRAETISTWCRVGVPQNRVVRVCASLPPEGMRVVRDDWERSE